MKYFERTVLLHSHCILTSDNCDSVGVRKFLTLTFDKPLSYKFRQFFTTELHQSTLGYTVGGSFELRL